MSKLSEEQEQEQETSTITIEELKPNTRNFNFTAKVLELGEKKEITKRFSGETHYVMDVLVGDPSGTTLFSAWNESIDEIEEGKTYYFNNVKTILFKKQLRVSLGRKGTIEPVDEDQTIDEVNKEKNMSEEEHNIPRRYFKKKRGSYDNRRRSYPKGDRRDKRQYKE